AQSALNELSTRAAGDPALYTRLLNMATESGKPANVLYVLALHRSGTVVESIEDLEEREKWRMRAHDSTGLTATRLMAAQRYLEANKFSKAREKLALCVQDSASLPKIRKYPDCAGDPFVRFGDEFAAKHSLDDAQWAYLQALSPVLKDKHFDPDELLSKLVGLADQYEKAGRGRDAKAFLQQVLLSLRKVGAQNTPVARQLNVRLAHCNNGSLRSSKILKE
ncbi:MAG: hypothetical protein JSS86_24000, partial [Cyanobacteria bacterium SZAS LIN-2]|nr:hypothetical protein [Cyanobacteria bacterium SZAS LIN-2]